MLDYLRNLFTCRRRDNDRGASAVEYGLLVAGIAAVIVVLVMTLGTRIEHAFQDTCDKITTTQDSGTCTNGDATGPTGGSS